MAGVASPMFRERRAGALRFLLGLAIGGVTAALVLGLATYLAGNVLSLVLPAQPRSLLLVGICAALGLADLLNRTPHVWRQVPQALARYPSRGLVAVFWGLDMGLLFTTQKVVSLMWAALAATLLLRPAFAPTLLVGTAVVSSAMIAVWTVAGGQGLTSYGTEQERRWTRRIRALSGIALLGMAITVA